MVHVKYISYKTLKIPIYRNLRCLLTWQFQLHDYVHHLYVVTGHAINNMYWPSAIDKLTRAFLPPFDFFFFPDLLSLCDKIWKVNICKQMRTRMIHLCNTLDIGIEHGIWFERCLVRSLNQWQRYTVYPPSRCSIKWIYLHIMSHYLPGTVKGTWRIVPMSTYFYLLAGTKISLL